MTPTAASYDYIFLGAGAAGWSLLLRILQEPTLAQKRILIIEPEAKVENDRTWCFWEKGDGFFESLIYHRWHQLQIADTQGPFDLKPNGYVYKMIRSAQLYKYGWNTVEQHQQVHVIRDRVIDITDQSIRLADGQTIARHEALVFNSIPPASLPQQPGKHYLLQHFLGWFIETDQPCFDSDRAMLMDFRTDQHGYTGFVYTLPLSPTSALVEYTLFSPSLLPREGYEAALRTYIQSYITQQKAYHVTETEFGVIPMTDAHFAPVQQSIVMLGTAGGQTKASSGYTFQFIQRHSQAIVEQLLRGESPIQHPILPAKRFRWYDSTLLHILEHQQLPGAAIFGRLYRKNPADRLFRFLDNQSSIWEELALMNTVDRWVFMRAGMKVL